MGTSFTPKTTLQKVPWNIIINDRQVLQPFDWYECPANKKALVRYRVQCDSLGAAAETYFQIVSGGNTRLAKWRNSGSSSASNQHPDNSTWGSSGALQQGGYAAGDITLEAGEKLQTAQDAGTNAGFNVFLSIQESDV